MKFSVYAKKDEPALIELPFYGYDNKATYCICQIIVTDEKDSIGYCTFRINVAHLLIEEVCDKEFSDGPLHIVAKRVCCSDGPYEIVIQYSDNVLTRLTEWFWNKVHLVRVTVFKF